MRLERDVRAIPFGGGLVGLLLGSCVHMSSIAIDVAMTNFMAPGRVQDEMNWLMEFIYHCNLLKYSHSWAGCCKWKIA